MQTAIINSRSYTYPATGFGAKAEATVKSDFFGLLNADKVDDDSSVSMVVNGSEAESADVSEIYALMRSSVTKPNVKSSAVVDGIEWNDEILASWLSHFGEADAIDTSNKINWESTGDQALTDEQIAELKSKYDVTNLSPQSYYDLMSELTSMNVLSAGDISGMFITKMPLPKNGMLVKTDSAPQRNFEHRYYNNIIGKSKDNIEHNSWLLRYVDSIEFNQMNNSITKDELNRLKSGYQDLIDFDNRLLSIFEKLA